MANEVDNTFSNMQRHLRDEIQGMTSYQGGRQPRLIALMKLRGAMSRASFTTVFELEKWYRGERRRIDALHPSRPAQ